MRYKYLIRIQNIKGTRKAPMAGLNNGVIKKSIIIREVATELKTFNFNPFKPNGLFSLLSSNRSIFNTLRSVSFLFFFITAKFLRNSCKQCRP